jgi:hypothetical protein
VKSSSGRCIDNEPAIAIVDKLKTMGLRELKKHNGVCFRDVSTITNDPKSNA